MEKYNIFERILEKEIKPAVGCTEPIAVSLCCAHAVKALADDKIQKITLKASTAIIKNTSGVTIPGTDLMGMYIATALGAVTKNPEKGLLLLDDLKPESIELAKEYVEQGNIEVLAETKKDMLYIEANVQGVVHSSQAIISGRHDNLILLMRDQEVLFNAENLSNDEEVLDFTIEEMFEFVKDAPISSFSKLKEGMDTNLILVKEGMTREYGHGTGHLYKKGSLEAWTAAGSDARMAGVPLAAMSVAGSGNQGITTMIPVIKYAQKNKKSMENTLRALALSALSTIYVKKSWGRLSPLCGVVGAATGASAGITFLMGGTNKQILHAMTNVLGTISGMLCDGAKADCSMKVGVAVSWAKRAAELAMQDKVITSQEGIVGHELDETLSALAKLSDKARISLDPEILSIMLEKEKLKKEKKNE